MKLHAFDTNEGVVFVGILQTNCSFISLLLFATIKSLIYSMAWVEPFVVPKQTAILLVLASFRLASSIESWAAARASCVARLK